VLPTPTAIDINNSDTRYHDLFTKMDEGFALLEVIDGAPADLADYRFLEVNPAFERMMEMPAAEITGHTLTEISPGLDHGWISHLNEVIRTGGRVEFESYARRLEKYFKVMAYSPAEGQVATLFVDFTDRRLAEAALMLSETKYRIIATNTLDWAFWINPQGQFLFCSPSCEILTGFTAEEFENDPGLLRRIVHQDDNPRAISLHHSLESDAIIDELEFRIVRRSGAVRWVSHICQPVYGPDGQFLGRRGSNRDITDRKTFEMELQEAHDTLEQRVNERTAELQRSNADLEQFAYISSHDLQEPLRMVASYVQLLERRYKGKLDSDADEFIGYAVDGATRMQALINDLLVLSRVGTRGKPMEPVKMSQVVAQAAANLQVAINESGAEVRCSDLPDINGDFTQLVQLFQNLIGNAIKFRGDGMPVVEISVAKDEAGWLFRVQDNGIGIHSAYFDRIFLVFQRLHSRQDYPGTGIGLAICKKIVERHAGRIWVESEPGQGTTFCFTIPSREIRL
jgi:PAS domain S-box-containing protein